MQFYEVRLRCADAAVMHMSVALQQRSHAAVTEILFTTELQKCTTLWNISFDIKDSPRFVVPAVCQYGQMRQGLAHCSNAGCVTVAAHQP